MRQVTADVPDICESTKCTHREELPRITSVGVLTCSNQQLYTDAEDLKIILITRHKTKKPGVSSLVTPPPYVANLCVIDTATNQ